MAQTMKAIVLDGIKKTLVWMEVPIPKLEKGEALVRTKAAAFNRRDWWIQQGQYAGLKFPIILGSDGAGIVEAVAGDAGQAWIGKEVIINPSIAWGDREAVQQKAFHILGLPQDGTFAQYVRVPVENLHEKPRHLTFEEAAALPLGGLTAYRALFRRAELKAGDKVLVVGVGGGVATFALQLAVHAGADAYVTSSKVSKIERAMALGAKGGVRYTDDGWSETLKEKVGGFDVIVDSALGDGFAHYLDLANPGGRIVFFGGTAGNIPELNGRQIFWKQLSLLGTTMGSPTDFRNMLEFVEHHQIKPVIDSVHPIQEAEEAIRKMTESSQFGKIVLKLE
ncbi:NADPH:quinone reductase [Parapedobacter luteus]|uniref:NADPH:quinone reductase n=1 Tax=Parapedobacter luteus TaxID=623280 RepID=A0A1T5BSA6_9SPHI|nr:zinc-binding dehydrogenase [Parapedobacter luteus]SKB50075.1 NADPH:quinone reductase [Parapedobacter luteus]